MTKLHKTAIFGKRGPAVSHPKNVNPEKLLEAGIIPSRIYSAYETAILLGVSKDTIYKMKDEGAIPFVRVRGQFRFVGWQLLNWLNGRLAHETFVEKPAKVQIEVVSKEYPGHSGYYGYGGLQLVKG